MSARKLFDWLSKQSVVLQLKGDQLSYDAPKGVMTPELLALLKANKQELIALLKNKTSGLVISPCPQDAKPVISFAQQRLWFLDQLDPANAFYNEPIALSLQGALDFEKLVQCLEIVNSRHDALRTRYINWEGVPTPVVSNENTVDLPVVDLTQEINSLYSCLQKESRKPFDLANGPLTRTRLYKLSEYKHVLLIVVHHIVGDGWSLGILMRELTQLYSAKCLNHKLSLPDLPFRYTDFAYWQREWLASGALTNQLHYWQQQLKDIPPLLELPTDYPRSQQQSYHGATLIRSLTPELSHKIIEFSKSSNLTVFVTLAAAFNLLLYRYAQQDDICIGFPTANRNHTSIENLIGFFVNTLVLRTRMQPHLSFNELLEQVRKNTLIAQENQDVPFERLVEEINPARYLSHSPLFQVMLNYRTEVTESVDLPNLRLRTLDVDLGIAKYDLTLIVLNKANHLECRFEYNTNLFNHSTIAQLADHFSVLLNAALAAPESRLASIALFTDDEKNRMLHQWNRTKRDYPSHALIHALFERHAALTPDSIAVVFEEESLTYGDLNKHANQLASYIQGRGMGSGLMIGLCLERSPKLLVAILGILKAGCSYIPLDPQYPEERLSYMIHDARPAFILTDKSLKNCLPPDYPCVYFDEGLVGGMEGNGQQISPATASVPSYTILVTTACLCDLYLGFNRSPKGRTDSSPGCC
jgi:hypothetical protein